MIRLHDSQTREVKSFAPQDPGFVTMYVCGPTVYGPAHIGNARPAVVFDQLFRLLRHQYGEHAVHYARNITDVDDKIIQAAREQNLLIHEITEPAYDAYVEDLHQLGCLQPTIEPRATRHIAGMVEMIGELIDKGHAYEIEGEVFFHVPSNPWPGLANHTNLDSGSRVDVDPRKRDPRDFVLWKPVKVNEPAWPSPWGDGRPGWHIECSAMIRYALGAETIDIHGGGQDLRFPHHEAECAQSQCAHSGAPLAHNWLHNGLLTVDGEKMSKSRGNVIQLSELFERYPAESVRYYFLKTHYRGPMNFSMDGLEQSHRALSGIYDVLYQHDELNNPNDAPVPSGVTEALCDDLNTPLAIARLHELAGELSRVGGQAAKARLLAAGGLLGLLAHTPHQWRTFGVDKDAIDALVAQRQNARGAKNWAEADRIRDQLLGMGIAIADGPLGTEWRKS